MVYVGRSVDLRARQVLGGFPNCRLVDMSDYQENHSAMFWRFLAHDIPGAQAVIFRDADSRIHLRERAAVDEWLASDKRLHIMRDHPNHTLPILGGMWGVRPDPLTPMTNLINWYGPDLEFSGDQRFLASQVYPRLASTCLVHQDAPHFVDHPLADVRTFPVVANGSGFVGQGFEANGKPREGHEGGVQGATSS